MSETPKCDDTTSGNTPNSSLSEAIGKPRKGAKNSTSKQSASSVSELLEGRFSLADLRLLTFHLTEAGPTIDVWHASASDFQAYVQLYADTENVNTDLWPMSERLYLLNQMWEFCEKHGHEFPFNIEKMLMAEAENA